MAQRMSALLAALLFGLTGAVWAADSPEVDRYKTQVRSLRGQLQQQQDARVQAEAARDELQSKLDALQREVEGLRSGVRQAEARSAELQRSVSTGNQERTTLSQQLQESEGKLKAVSNQARQLAEQLRSRETDNQGLQRRLLQEQTAMSVCRDHNEKLAQYGLELMERYQDKGFWSALFESEPVTGLAAVEVESIFEEYRDKISREQLPAQAVDAAPPAP